MKTVSVKKTDPFFGLVTALDIALMQFYAHVRKNTRRTAHLVVALVPLMMLLVGSCKTSDLPASYGSNAGPEQFRMALFPDSVNYKGDDYAPAAGYISRAQKYVAGAPESLDMLTEKEVAFLFGKPEMTRKDADARIWQYKTDACVVDFYFYGADTDAAPVSYVDYRGQDADNKNDCLKEITDRV